MDALTGLKNINWFDVIIGFVALVLAGQFIYKTIFEGIIQKFGWETKKMRERREAYEQLKAITELAKTTAENLNKLQTRHTQDEEEFRNNLNNYIEESRADRKALHDEMSKFAEGQGSRDKQIEALMCGSKELLGSTIDQLYSKYIELDGVPESEIDEFDDIFHAYKKLNGNHRRDTKYNYVKTHLRVIPVETKLVIKHEE